MITSVCASVSFATFQAANLAKKQRIRVTTQLSLV